MYFAVERNLSRMHYVQRRQVLCFGAVGLVALVCRAILFAEDFERARPGGRARSAGPMSGCVGMRKRMVGRRPVASGQEEAGSGQPVVGVQYTAATLPPIHGRQLLAACGRQPAEGGQSASGEE